MTNIEALLLRADAALYQAKAAGRNRLVMAGEEPALPIVAQRAAASTVVPFPERKSAA